MQDGQGEHDAEDVDQKMAQGGLRASLPATRDARITVEVVPMLAPSSMTAPPHSDTTPPAASVMMGPSWRMNSEGRQCRPCRWPRCPGRRGCRFRRIAREIGQSGLVTGGTPSLSRPRPTNMRVNPITASPAGASGGAGQTAVEAHRRGSAGPAADRRLADGERDEPTGHGRSQIGAEKHEVRLRQPEKAHLCKLPP